MRRKMLVYVFLGAVTIGGIYACGADVPDEPVVSNEPTCPDGPTPTDIAPSDGGKTVTITPVPCEGHNAPGSSASSTSGATTSGGENSSSGKLGNTTSGSL